MSTVNLSIIVPAYNEEKDLPNLLRSLMSLGSTSGCEIIVVDNGSSDQTSLIAEAAKVCVVRIGRASIGRARNVGGQVASGKVLAFLDADVIVTPEWIGALTGLAAAGGRPGFVTGDTYDVVRPPSWIERYWFGALYRRGAKRYINGGNVILTREDFATVGGFNEEMSSGEDVEFCERCRASGLVIAPDRSLRVMHSGYPSSARRFIEREAWHGRGDFRSVNDLMHSPVALLALVFLLAHVIVAIFVISGAWRNLVLAIASIVCLCLVCSWLKWSNEPVRVRLINAVVFYLYFVGRALGAIREVWVKL